MAEVISFRNPGLFYVALPFGRVPIISSDGTLAEDVVGNAVEKEGNQQLQMALNEFYR